MCQKASLQKKVEREVVERTEYRLHFKDEHMTLESTNDGGRSKSVTVGGGVQVCDSDLWLTMFTTATIAWSFSGKRKT